MKNQTTTILLILLLVGAFFYLQQKPEPLGITVDYYSNGEKVSGLFATYIKYDQIRLNIYASNTGDYEITNIQLVDASPQIFRDNLPSLSFENLRIGEKNKLILTSNLMNVDDLVLLPQPVNFWVKISGKDESNKIIYEETTMQLTFVEEISGIVEIETVTLTNDSHYMESPTLDLSGYESIKVVWGVEGTGDSIFLLQLSGDGKSLYEFSCVDTELGISSGVIKTSGVMWVGDIELTKPTAGEISLEPHHGVVTVNSFGGRYVCTGTYGASDIITKINLFPVQSEVDLRAGSFMKIYGRKI